MCINGRMYVCCSECYVVFNECDEPIPDLYDLSVRTVVKLCTLGCFYLFRGAFGFMNYDHMLLLSTHSHGPC